MTKYLQKCKVCNKYGLANPDSKCRYCGGQLVNPRPPKFSLIDKYWKYRLVYFKEEFDEKFK
ncbi:MAG: nucleolar RNA-binding Nop10p family protein [Candidatus Hodarchaeales archaeon]|jgi:rRNA maturation protein Nop10